MLAACRYHSTPMPRHQNEAAKACSSNSSLPPGTSRGAGHVGRYNGVVGIGSCDQNLAAARPQVTEDFSSPRLPREADSRWTYLLPPRRVHARAAGSIHGKKRGNTAMNSFDPIVKSNDLWRGTHWFAIHAKPRRENFAAISVRAVGIGILLPRVKVERLVGGAAQEGTKPLFPGYFFARFCPEDSFESVKGARGVLQVVSAGRIPIPVGDLVVREIQDRIQKDGLIRIRSQHLDPGTRVSIQGGPFEGMMGRVERELDDRKRVAIFLETLLNARVLIERRWIEAQAA